MVRMRMVVMRPGEVPMTAVVGNLPPPRPIHEHTTATIVTTATPATPDPRKTHRAGSRDEPNDGRTGKSAILRKTVRRRSPRPTDVAQVV
jgi:hypothetical protein